MAEAEYQRLTHAHPRSGFAVAFAARSSLWLGKDHLLCIDSTGYSETYKRFYFRDIQAVLLRKTGRGKIWNFVLGVPGGLMALFTSFAVAGGDVVTAWILGTVAALFLLALLLNLAAGPACACQLRTAVQTEELASLHRLRQTRKVLNRLRPLIVEAQGELAPEEIPTRLEEWAASTASVGASSATNVRYVVDDPNAPPRIIS